MNCFGRLSANLISGVLTTLWTVAAAQPTKASSPTSPAGPPLGSERARLTLEQFPSRGARTDHSVPPRSPAETVASFKLMDGLEAECVLDEPGISQPLFLNFDERGRMWVVEFRQYPYPAGLRIVDLDDQFHAVYDKVPPPPPHHDRGADRITIHTDTDGDGTFDSHKVFLDGLNMATSVERGRDGVWVLHPPYLLFYPEADGDDVPDGDPVVHLAGFGLEDTHSAANSLRWGPDGSLYGATGSGVSSTIKRPGIDDGTAGLYFKGQTIWRYHPERRVFELFAEGGGNTFGIEFDAQGRCFSGINGNAHRGFHFVQGGNYSKNWGEHGYLTNPYAFGYFSAMPHAQEIPRFSHTFVTYEAEDLPSRFKGKLIAPVPLHNYVMLTDRLDDGSTYRTSDLGKFLETDDRWFRPVDIKVGPDGAVYVADWYDTRLSHMDPRDTWDRAHGRIYRIRAKNSKAIKPFDLSALSSAELVNTLGHPNKWWRQTALRLLADRRDRSVIPLLKGRLGQSQDERALDALWALHAVGGFNDDIASTALTHRRAEVRLWTVRFLGERNTGLSSKLTDALISLARGESDAQVCSQLASTAKRLRAEAALPVIFELARRDEDRADPHVPLLLWWALESKAISNRSDIIAAFRDPTLWSAPMVRQHLLPRLARRYASAPTPENQQALSSLLKPAPDQAARQRVIEGINEAFKGGGATQLTLALEEPLTRSSSGPRDTAELALALRRGEPGALAEALAVVANENSDRLADRLVLIEALGDTKRSEAAPVLIELLARSTNGPARAAALGALGKFELPNLANDLLAIWSNLDAALRRSAVGVLCSRRVWASTLLGAVGGSGTISKRDMPDEMVERIRLLGDPELSRLADRFFGNPRRATSEEKRKRIAEASALITQGPPGHAVAGKTLFQARCAVCHQLFGEGGSIGPELTGYERTNLEEMLLGIVDPSIAIREGFTQFQITTKDERTILGFVHQRDGTQVTLRDTGGQLTTLSLREIREEKAVPTSLMPEGLLEDLDPQELRDLFTYLMSNPPNVSARK